MHKKAYMLSNKEFYEISDKIYEMCCFFILKKQSIKMFQTIPLLKFELFSFNELEKNIFTTFTSFFILKCGFAYEEYMIQTYTRKDCCQISQWNFIENRGFA